MRFAILVLLAMTATAHAAKTRVFPLSGLKDPVLITTLTTKLASSIKAELANVPIEDAAGLLECDPEASSCLVSVAKQFTADRLVFGTITQVSDTKLKITLTKFEPAGPDRQQRTFEITGSSPDALATDLVKVSGPLFGKAKPIEDQPDGPDKPDKPDKPDIPDETPKGKVSSTTWAITGGGAIGMAAGVGFLLSAQSLKDPVATAPHDTVEDFQKLKALEDKGILRTRIGDVLLVVGGAAVIYGVIRIVTESRKHEVIVTPAPTDGGAAIFLTVIR